MAPPTYAKNYYHVLGLAGPSLRDNKPARNAGGPQAISAKEVKAAYRKALLSAHPDKRASPARGTTGVEAGTGTGMGTGTGGEGGGREDKRLYTIDDVKEAYTVLADEKSRGEFDGWLRARFDEGVLRFGDGDVGVREAFRGVGVGHGGEFVLGLEVLDLSDFEEGVVGGAEGCEGLEWYRACRCGDEKGFRIREEELEEAEGRGEKEVLVGCEGCSLWVRVGFEVEEG